MQGIQKFHRTLPERRKKKSCADLRAQVPPNRLLECSTKKPSQFWKTGQHPRGTSLEERVHLQNPKKEHAPSRRKTFFRDPILLSLEGRNAYRKTKVRKKEKGLEWKLHRQGLNGEFTTQIYNLEEYIPTPYL